MKMDNKKIKKLVCVIVMVILLAQLINSLRVKNIFHGELETFVPFWEYLVLKPIVIRFFAYVVPLTFWLKGDGTSFVKNFERVIEYNPPVDIAKPFIKMLLKILLPLYSLLILLVAFYLLFVSASPRGRTKAKDVLWKLFATMMLISLSPLLIEVIFRISEQLTENIFTMVGVDNIRDVLDRGLWGMYALAVWTLAPDFELATIPLVLLYVFVWAPYITICLRNILLTALMIFFPLGILLYFIQPLKSIGKAIIEQFLSWTFLQCFMALALVAVTKAFLITKFVVNPRLHTFHWELTFAPIGAIGGPAGVMIASVIAHLINDITGFITGWGPLSDINILPICDSSIPIKIVEGVEIPIPFCYTDLSTLGFGIVAHMVIVISPIVIILIFKRFLP